MENENLILFDGVCNFCNGSVNFVIRRDKRSLFKFLPFQSPLADELMRKYEVPVKNMESFVLIENGTCYVRSTAALRVCRKLNGLWPALYGLIVVPRFIRDWVYDIIAKNRYKWFGKRDQCIIPTPGIKARFIQ